MQTSPFLLSLHFIQGNSMPCYHVSMKSAKPGTAHEHFRYITRQGSIGHTKRHELVHWEHRNMPAWTPSPGEFFDAADQHERANGSAYREFEISLPKELSLQKNIELARRIADDLLDPRPCVLAIHLKEGAISGEPHPHLHAMFSDRACDGLERQKESYFGRFNSADPAKGGVRKLSGGKTPAEMFGQARETRKRVADTINEVLAENGVPCRVDHRSAKDQGTSKKAERYLGPKGVQRLSTKKRTKIMSHRAAVQPNM
jgi:hypothetical protein